MNDNPRTIAPDDRPRLADGVRIASDPATGQPILLHSEGIVGLDPTGIAILHHCDGRRTLDEIALDLQSEFAAPLEVVRSDVIQYLEQLRTHHLIEVSPAQGST